MKDINSLTIKEFQEFISLLEENPVNIEQLFDLFDVDVNKLNVDEYKTLYAKIMSMQLSGCIRHKIYTINGRRYSLIDNIKQLNAAQFIDFQQYMSNYKIENVLSIFLIPQVKTWYGWKNGTYNKDYDMSTVIDDIYNYLHMSDAKVIADFFFQQSVTLLEITQASLMKKKSKMMKKNLKEK